MKNIKKLIAAIIMCCFGAAIGIVGIFVNDNSKKEATLIKWKENALVNPTPGKMIGAGNIDITIANLEDIYENSEKYGSACNSAWSYGDGSFFRGKKGAWKIKTDSHCKCFKISGACSHFFADCSLAWIS